MLNPPEVQELHDIFFEKRKITFFVLNLEKIHPTINGNKYFKLKYNLEEFLRSDKKRILTFGGAFSNHILACAAAGKAYGFDTIGVIRGEELNSESNFMLKSALEYGMKLKFISREIYREKESEELIANLKMEFSDFYLLPEGGSNSLAVKGCAEIPALIDEEFDWICCACGTGGTIAGISMALKKNQKALGITVVNAKGYFEKQIMELLGTNKIPEKIELKHEFHFGGYAKNNAALETFRIDFMKKYQLKIDKIYNSKLFFGVFKLIEEGYFAEGSRIVCVNTGGNYE